MIRKLPKELRGKRRGPISVPVEYTVVAEDSVDKKKVTGKGSTADLSQNGIGIFSNLDPEPGTIIEIECDDIWEKPRKFEVKWCDKITYGYFRLGLKVHQ